ncbi:MAG: gliding motility-associated C-terminal domain-containing protein, partial [Crocinitomicaceae bacterium]|nr:gliding motility-associated C-terminal domain-containing protein [Crocinitomicaceae bacterium]
VSLIASGETQNDTYLWSNGSNGPINTVSADGSYSVIASNECGSATDTAVVMSMPCTINIPNIIVLSSIAGNNALYIDYTGIQTFNLTIVNRWGNIVFETSDPLVVWDGTQNGIVLSEGIYSYVLNATLMNNEGLTNQGFIHLFH